MAAPLITNVGDLDAYLVRKYITACPILHFHSLVDAYEDISVRLSPTTFLMSRYLAPALVAPPADLVNAEPLIPNSSRGGPLPSTHQLISPAPTSLPSSCRARN